MTCQSKVLGSIATRQKLISVGCSGLRVYSADSAKWGSATSSGIWELEGIVCIQLSAVLYKVQLVGERWSCNEMWGLSGIFYRQICDFASSQLPVFRCVCVCVRVCVCVYPLQFYVKTCSQVAKIKNVNYIESKISIRMEQGSFFTFLAWPCPSFSG